MIVISLVLTLDGMKYDSYYWDITARYLQGKANATEQNQLKQWREAQAEHETQFKAQEKLWKLTEYTLTDEVDAERAWNLTRLKIEATVQDDGSTRKIFYSSLKIAASIAIVFSIIWLFKSYLPGDEMVLVKSGNKMIKIVLPDSSHVWLNKESQLTYKKDFSEAERKVNLEGEGFFEVKRNPKRPFIITTGISQTEVLGTSFNLRNYPADTNISLTVATGRVLFKAEGGLNEAVITPEHGATISKSNNTLSEYSISDKNAWAWKSGKLKFENKPLQEVLLDLERFYQIKFRLQNNSLGKCRFSGNFENATLEEVLQVLEITMNLNYKRAASHTILISGEGCNN